MRLRHALILALLFGTASSGFAQETSDELTSCPDGASFAGVRPPGGSYFGCEKPGGVKHGTSLIWDENGKLLERRGYVDGVEHGPFSSWYSSGAKRKQGVYDHGKMSGLWLRWHESGGKQDEGRWEEGVPDGLWTFWRENGEIQRQVVFEKGVAREVEIPSAARDPIGFRLRSMEVAPVFVTQGESGKTYSILASWSPSMRWFAPHAYRPAVGLRGLTGFTMLQTARGGRFVAFGQELLLQLGPWQQLPLSLELGGGVRYWHAAGGTFAMASGRAAWSLEEAPLLKFIDRIVLGWSQGQKSGLRTRELGAGIGISF